MYVLMIYLHAILGVCSSVLLSMRSGAVALSDWFAFWGPRAKRGKQFQPKRKQGYGWLQDRATVVLTPVAGSVAAKERSLELVGFANEMSVITADNAGQAMESNRDEEPLVAYSFLWPLWLGEI